jgi:hypothetical protein
LEAGNGFPPDSGGKGESFAKRGVSIVQSMEIGLLVVGLALLPATEEDTNPLKG